VAVALLRMRLRLQWQWHARWREHVAIALLLLLLLLLLEWWRACKGRAWAVALWLRLMARHGGSRGPANWTRVLEA